MSFREIIPTINVRFGNHFEHDYSPPLSPIEALRAGYLELDGSLSREEKIPIPNLDPLLSAVKERMLHTDVKNATRELNLNESEVFSILVYTADWPHFGIPLEESLPYLLNYYRYPLCARNYWRPFFFCLLKGLEKLPLFQGWAFKGIKTKLEKNPFSPCALIISLTTSEPELNDSIQTLLKINVSKGRMLGALSMNPLEGELLILPYSFFDYDGKTTNQGKLDIRTQRPYKSLLCSNPFIAAKEGNLEALKYWYLQHCYAGVYDAAHVYGSVLDAEHNNASLLYTAARFGQTGVVELLLKEGPSKVNVVQNQGSSALHAAAYYGHFEVVKILVGFGIDVNIRNKWNCTALDEARTLVQNGQQWKDIVHYLENPSLYVFFDVPKN